MEAYLLLEAARSNRQISRMRTDLAVEIVHRNTIALQFNRLVLERAQNDLRAADELVGYVRLSIRQSGHSAASQYAMQECNLPRRTASKCPSSFGIKKPFILTHRHDSHTSLRIPCSRRSSGLVPVAIQ